MKPKSTLCALGAALALFGALAFPRPSSGQAGQEDDPRMNQLVTEIMAQQSVIADNQTKIDAQVAAIAEDIRVSRIFAGRSGGKAGGK